MHTRRTLVSMTVLLVLVFGWVSVGSLAAQGPTEVASPATLTAGNFTYQGELNNNGAPINGQCDFTFMLFPAATGGTQIGTTALHYAVQVVNGRFSVELNGSVTGPFGNNAFVGPDRWLSVAVRCPSGSGTFTPLNPRQSVTAAPYALGLKPGIVVEAEAVTNAIFSGINTSSTNGNGIVGIGPSSGVVGNGTASSGPSNGVLGYTVSSATNSAGVYGANYGGGAGVYGLSSGYDGVYGESSRTLGNGVHGVANNGTGAYGVWGRSQSGVGVAGYSPDGRGVYGFSVNHIGIYGSSTNAIGVHGTSSNNVGVTGSGAMGGVQGRSTNETGVYGNSQNGSGIVGFGGGNYPSIWALSSGTNPAVTGQQHQSGSGSGVEGVALSGNGIVGASQSGWSGIFYGNVNIAGAVYASSKYFRIDHPLDPMNQYLQHAAIESDALKTIYDGVAVLDADGRAVVQLPEWFEALNRDFRYQLTAINAPGPSLYIANEIRNNQFTIAGGSAGMKVSWQVTGIRQDTYAIANPLQVELPKPVAEQGTLLTPDPAKHPNAPTVAEQFYDLVNERADPSRVLAPAPDPALEDYEAIIEQKLQQK